MPFGVRHQGVRNALRCQTPGGTRAQRGRVAELSGTSESVARKQQFGAAAPHCGLPLLGGFVFGVAAKLFDEAVGFDEDGLVVDMREQADGL